MLTSTNASTESICKAFYVARAHAVTDPPFNKLIDSGPDGSNDFAVTFVGDRHGVFQSDSSLLCRDRVCARVEDLPFGCWRFLCWNQ